jgi:AhpD family alkylhydroperoxidase
MSRPGSAYARIAPSVLTGLFSASEIVAASRTLPTALLDLVFLRASQLNGCGFCLEMHVAEALLAGEAHERLHALPVWRESSRFTPREKAALAWTEAVTRIAEGVTDAAYDAARAHFSDAELVELTHAVCVINSWNRLNVAFGSAPEDGLKAVRRRAVRGAPEAVPAGAAAERA